jgi:hypothetical protein
MRSLVISAIAVSLIGFTPQIALAKGTYTLQSYPEGFSDPSVPCSAFKRLSNGGWQEAAVFVYKGQRFTGSKYAPGSHEAGIISQKCGGR